MTDGALIETKRNNAILTDSESLTTLDELPEAPPLLSKNHGLGTLVKGVSASEERRTLARWAAQKGLARFAARYGNQMSSLHGWSMIVEAQAELAHDTTKARSTEAARFIGEATGFSTKDQPAPAESGLKSVTSTAIQAIYELVQLLRIEKDTRSVVDAQVIDVE